MSCKFLYIWAGFNLEKTEMESYLFLLRFTTRSMLIIFQWLLSLLNVLGQIIAFIFNIFYNFAVYLKLSHTYVF